MCVCRAVPEAIPVSLGTTLQGHFLDTPLLSATYLLHQNRSCWLLLLPPLEVGAGGQGP